MRRQAGVRGIVEANGPLTARDAGEYHLPIGASSARSALERRVSSRRTTRAGRPSTSAPAPTPLARRGSETLAAALRDSATAAYA